MKKIDKEKLNISKIKEMWKDKKGKAKIELSAYLIFFLIVVIFTRVASTNYNNIEKTNNIISFMNNITDNYEFNINIKIDDDIYNYHGKHLGNNAYIERNKDEETKEYYIINNKYYELDNNGNYILTTIQEVYPYISYNYINIENIKNFINNSIKEDNIYKLKIADIILNSTNSEEITIKLDEQLNSIEIDYTNLFKIDNKDITKAIVIITFSNINNIISLEK